MLHPDAAGGLSFESEQIGAATNNRHYLSAGGVSIGVLVSSGALPTLTANQTAPAILSSIILNKVEYWHKDHLGSLVATTDHNGTVTARYSYDPFGKRRTASGNYDANGALVIDWNSTSSGTDRGYTGHEHLDDVGIIHMNGRLFDPRLGRFMQGDPLIQDPGNLQNYNRYAYCYNNPMTCTDPTGQWNWSNILNTNVGANLFFFDAGSFMLSRATARNKTGYQLGSIAIGVLSAFWCEGAAYLCNAAGQAVWSGFAGRTFEESLKTGVIAGATSYAMGAVGTAWNVNADPSSYNAFMNTVGHAAVGCGSSVASGGSCKSGALAGGFSAAWSNYGPSYEAVNGNSGILIKNTMIAATVGGAGSVIGGGKFWNGAQTGAFGYLFNFAAHEGKDYFLNSKEFPLRILWEGTAQWLDENLPSAHYAAVSGTVLNKSATFSIDLSTGDIYFSPGAGISLPGPSLKPGFSFLVGRIRNYEPGDTPQFLTGAGASGTLFVPLANPWIGPGAGVNHSFGGKTAIEIGVGTPGFGVTPVGVGFELKSKKK